MDRLKRAEAALLRVEGAALVALLTVMIALSFWQVALRQLFGTGLLWADTLLRHLVVVVGFLGAAIAASENKNFAFELLSHAKGRAAAALRAAANGAGAVVAALLARAAWHYYLDEKSSGAALFSAGEVTVPASWFAVTIPAGFLLVALHTALAAASAGVEAAVAPDGKR